ncbi:unnamed protein product [Rotaria sordida]|uniref:Uncharacterized protein n=1 Tax=Rotaria sordida TaxID=392033 RepID=A0A818YUJ4_9BILA|nr:unnamed protein product [Rotaria sordida]CAF1271272.1 unnamed protein product [Rotaria sordida]CAF3754901.1 unnamed protein product [Rotaria sordida]CAF3778810.1 unnamed protein product [Rotaria sordida]
MLYNEIFLGGVAMSDKIGNTNLTVVNQLCRSDGVLFRPERPATAMDSTFLEQNFFVEYVMITNLTESYTFSWNELFNTEEDDYPNRRISDIYVVFELENPRDYYWFTSTNISTILIPSCAQDLITYYSSFHLFVFVPFSKSSNWILFGELNKQLPITRQRFVQTSITIGYSEHVLRKIDIYTV